MRGQGAVRATAGAWPVGSSFAVAASLLKNVYDSVIVVTWSGSAGSTMKRTGIARCSPACSSCSVKQKHSVLLKYVDATDGATDGAALPTIAWSDVLVAT